MAIHQLLVTQQWDDIIGMLFSGPGLSLFSPIAMGPYLLLGAISIECATFVLSGFKRTQPARSTNVVNCDCRN